MPPTTISEYSKQDLIRHLGVEPKRILLASLMPVAGHGAVMASILQFLGPPTVCFCCVFVGQNLLPFS